MTFAAVLFVISCKPVRNIAYFPTLRDSVISSIAEDVEPMITKSDILNITVYTPDPEASANINRASGGVASSASSGGGGESGYLVNKDGFIQFPLLGQVKAAGLTKKELTAYLTQQLTNKKLLLDPIISIRQANFHVTVMGEVGRATVIPVPSEQINILEAITTAGDVTVGGKKETVLLIRQEAGKKITRRLNIASNEILTSPYYYLRSGDILYVEPTEKRLKDAEGRQSLLPIILSSASVLILIFDRIVR